MATTVTVSLSIATAATDGYTQCKDSAGNALAGYYYKFSGGDAIPGNGNVTARTANAEVDIVVSLDSGSNGSYNISSAKWKALNAPGGNNPDISIAAPSGNKVTLTDSATVKGEVVKYNVVVLPKNATTPEIYCDPTVSNEW